MSIIYEALKKLSPRDVELRGPKETSAQNSSRGEPEPDHPGLTPASVAVKPGGNGAASAANKRKLILALAGTTVGILVTWIIMNKLTAPLNSPAASPIKEAQPVHPAIAHKPLSGGKGWAQEAPELILNGIVLSADGNLALINEEILKVGDDIRGAKVEEITDKQVTLTFQNQEIILKKR